MLVPLNKNFTSLKYFKYKGRDIKEEIQPSQLYINSAKLAHVQNHFDPSDTSSYNAVPVKRLDGEGIETIKDLENKVVSPEKFERLWIKRCHNHEAHE